jgi:hypothetical protein
MLLAWQQERRSHFLRKKNRKTNKSKLKDSRVVQKPYKPT